MRRRSTRLAVQPCTLFTDEAEGIWEVIAQTDDWAPFHAKSRGSREMGVALAIEDEASRFDEGLARGARLFEAGSFFDAHEAWEESWRSETDANRRRFVQGLIQVAAAFHKTRLVGTGAPDTEPTRAALRILDRALAKLEALPADVAEDLSMDVAAFAAGVRGCARALQDGSFHPSAIPRIGWRTGRHPVP